MTESRDFTPADWDRLVQQYVQTMRLSVHTREMTPAEADAHLAEFFQVAADQRPRAAFRESWRSVDARLARGEISQVEAERLRREILAAAADFGLGEPPW